MSMQISYSPKITEAIGALKEGREHTPLRLQHRVFTNKIECSFKCGSMIDRLMNAAVNFQGFI